MNPLIQSRLRFLAKLMASYAVLLTVLCVIAGARGWLSPGRPGSSPAAATNGTERVKVPSIGGDPGVQESASDEIKVIRFSMRERGFDPAETTVPAGRYFVVVNNRSDEKEVSIRLQRGSQRIKDDKVPKGKIKWRGDVHLVPGEYQLSEANHPQWLARIIVTAK